MKKGNSEPITPALAAELRVLEAMPDADIDTTDIPVTSDWSGAERGRFHRPAKRRVTLQLDADLLAFFEAGGTDAQGRINDALRQWVEARRPRAAQGTG